MRFILWNRDDGFSPRRDAGEVVSDGVLGRIDADNVYLKVYADYPGTTRPADLDVGGCLADVVFRLSGEKGEYDIYRVE